MSNDAFSDTTLPMHNTTSCMESLTSILQIVKDLETVPSKIIALRVCLNLKENLEKIPFMCIF